MEPWVRVLALSAGGVAGVNARYWQGVWMSRWVSSRFPWATFTVNVSGSFAIGFLSVVLSRWGAHPHARLMIVTGFLGGYTTFSALAYDSVTLWHRGGPGPALGNLVGSAAAGFVAVVLGIGLARAVVGDTPGPAEPGGVPRAPEVRRARPEPTRPEPAPDADPTGS